MHYYLGILSWMIFSIQICFSVDVSINTTSSFSFPEKIIKTAVSILEGQEFLFILFRNGTVSKLDSQLQFVEQISTLDNASIIDF